ncbi:MAG TPA: TonB-dependent receptor [Vicinamibacteria bacterium]|nr:TonB-dependent receptor [Vicinamibacteria bacterium]
MRRLAITALALGIGSGLASGVFAQTTTGTIVGTVQDVSHGALRGVTVSVVGERIMGTQSSSTDDRGQYRFVGLPPGEYEVTFTLKGFAPLRRTLVRVTVGGTVEENGTLEVAGASETVSVQASSAVVDSQTTQVGTTYDRAFIDNAPIQRQSFFDVLASAPGVDPNDPRGFQPSSYGSMFDQNLYQLDGIDLTNNFGGGIPTLVQPSTDIMEEVQIMSLGAPAEYGNVQGAVFNVVTRQGTNKFHGDAAYYYQSDGLSGRNTTPAEDFGFPFTRVAYQDISAQLGGPVAKDKLWFFLAYQHRKDASTVQIAPQFATSTKVDHYFGKLNFQPTAKHTIVGALNYDDTEIVFPLHPGEAPESQEGRRRRIYSPTVTYTALFGDRTVLETRYAGFYTNDKDGTLGGARQIATRFENRDTGQISGAVFGWFEYNLSRTTLVSKLSHHATDFLRTAHDFKFGVQYNSAPIDGVYGINDRVYLTRANGQLQGYGYQYTPFAYGGTSKNVGVFVDDSVQVGRRLNLIIGLRYDYTHTSAFAEPQLDAAGNPTGKTFPGIDYYTWNTFSPRIGFNLKLTEDGKTVLKGHYGRYYRGGMTGEFANVVPSVSPTFAGTWNFQTQAFQDLSLAFDNTNQAIDTNLKAPKTDQFTLSFERELFKDLNLTASYVHKRSRDYPGWLDVRGVYTPITYTDSRGAGATGASFTVQKLVSSLDQRFFLLTTPDGTASDVNAFSLTVSKRMSSHWQLTSSVDLVRSRGDRINGLTGQLNFSTFGQDPNDYVNSNGLLARDRFVVVKAQVLYTGLPGGFTVGANYYYADGYPIPRMVPIPATNLPRPVKAQPLTDGLRFPSLSVLDLRLQKDIRFGGDARLSVFANVFNVFNSYAFQSNQSMNVTSANFQQPNQIIMPVRAMLGAKVSF